MDGLIHSDKDHEQLKKLVDVLVERQVKEGPRAGSFNAEANPSFYYDYTPPLALIAAYEEPRTSEADQAKYLNAVKDWLRHSHKNQRKDGTVTPFGIQESNVPCTEAAAGVAWVASWYKEAIANREDKAELSAISDKDPHALDTMVSRSLTALETAQAVRTDGLIDSAQTYPFAYYTANAHIHGALASTMQTYGEDSELYVRAKAVDDKLVKGMKEFLVAGKKAGHIPFRKGHEADSFVQWEGHEVIVDAYAGMLQGKNGLTDALKSKFEKDMSDPVGKPLFLHDQTVPASVPMALAASGYTSVSIDGKDTPLSQVMSDQIAHLQAEVSNDYLHRISIAALAGYKGSAWLPPLDAPVEAAEEVAQTKPEPAVDAHMDAAFSQTVDELIRDASLTKPAPVTAPEMPEMNAGFNEMINEFLLKATGKAPVTMPPSQRAAAAAPPPHAKPKKKGGKKAKRR